MNNDFPYLPYPGLRPFKRDETSIFFGREQHTDQLLEKLDKTPHFIAVVGPSGCGKSSLVRTGLLGGIELGLLVSASSHWHIVEMRPGKSPFSNLAEQLLEVPVLGQAYDAMSLEKDLRRGSFSLHEILQKHPLPDNAQLLLVVDQFEEIFRYYKEGDPNETIAFVALLLASCQYTRAPIQKEGGRNIYVVITMRSDFIGDCALFQDLPEAVNNGLFLTPRLTRDQLREAIELPARIFGGEVEPELVNRLLNDAEFASINQLFNEVESYFDQLPLLQHALMRMWNIEKNSKTLSLAHYKKIGGLKKALNEDAEEAYKELLDPTQQKIAEILFRSLTERNSNGHYTRRPVELKKVAELANVSWEQVKEVVEVFRKKAKRCFLTPPLSEELTPNTMLDISHESLIRQWQRLRDWADIEADDAKLYRHLEEDACEWKKIGRSDSRLLWQAPRLDEAWKLHIKKEPMMEHWTKRYGKDFKLAMLFLKKSETKQWWEKIKKRVVSSLVIVFIVVIGALFILNNAEKQRTESLFESHLTHAALLAQVEDYAKAKKVLKESQKLDNKIHDSSRHHARNLVEWFSELMGGEPQQEYKGAGAILYVVAVSPDGRLLAAAGDKGTLVLFDLHSGEVLHHLKKDTKEDIEEKITAIGFHPQGKWLASAGCVKEKECSIIFWSLKGKKLSEWSTNGKVKALAIDPNGTYLATGGDDKNNITIWDLATHNKRTFHGHTKSISEGGLTFNHSGELLASASADNTARLWEVKTGKEKHVLQGHGDVVENLAFSPDNKSLATGSRDRTIRLWNIQSGKIMNILSGHKNGVYGLSFVTDGHYLVSASVDRTLRIWDIDNGVTLRVLQGHDAIVNDIVTYTGQVFSASSDGTVRRWNTALSDDIHFIDVDNKPTAVAIAPNGNNVAVGFYDGTLRLYSLPNLALLWSLQQDKSHKRFITDISFNSEGTLLASVSYDTRVKLWRLKNNTLQHTKTFFADNKIYAVAFSPTNNFLATALNEGKINLFSIDTGHKFSYEAHEGKTLSVSFNSSGTQLLSSGLEGGIKLWNVNDKSLSLSLQKTFPKALSMVMATAFGHDDNWIITAGKEQIVKIYSTDTYNKDPRKLVGHEKTIHNVISHGKQQVVTASSKSIKFWDLTNDTNTELFSLHLPTRKFSWDFDFRCIAQNCWIVAPLENKLVLYQFKGIYD